MRLYQLFLLLLVLPNSATWCQAGFPRVHPEKTVWISKENILDDLDAYREGIEANHTNPFENVSKREFREAIEELKQSGSSRTVDEILVALMKVNALIGDTHTMIQYQSQKQFPFRCYWFSDGIYIIKTNQENDKYLLSKIIAVQNQPIEAIVKRMSPLIPSKNSQYIKNRIPHYLFDPFILHGLGICETRGSARYTVVTQTQDTANIVVTPEDMNELPTVGHGMYKRKRVNYWYKYLDSANALYFNYSSCHEDSVVKFDSFEKALIACIEQRNPDKLIIDLRTNSGGHATQLENFIEYLKFSPLNRRGKLFALVGRVTFSAAVMNVSALRESTYITVVGEPTSGNQAFWGAVKWFTLPHTKLLVSYSTRYWAGVSGTEKAFAPNVLIPETVQDYQARNDAALQYALRHR